MFGIPISDIQHLVQPIVVLLLVGLMSAFMAVSYIQRTKITRLEREANEAQRRIDKLAREATVDELTGLFNLRGLETMWSRAQASMQRHKGELYMFLLDVNRFKPLNDTLGHNTGDLALKEISATLRAILREQDVIARIGGDEFLVIMPHRPDEDPMQLLDLANRIYSATVHSYGPRRSPLSVSLSIGAVRVKEGESLAHAKARADRHMYAAKKLRDSDQPTISTQIEVVA